MLLALLGGVASAVPARAQTMGATLTTRITAMSDSITSTADGADQPAPSAARNGGVFAETNGLWSRRRGRQQIEFGGGLHLRTGTGTGTIALDERSAHASWQLRSSRTTRLESNWHLTISPRYAIGIPQPDQVATAASSIDLPAMRNTTTGGALRLSHEFDRRTSGELQLAAERLALAAGSSAVTLRLSGSTARRLTRSAGAVLRLTHSRAASSGAGQEVRSSSEMLVGLSWRHDHTSMTAGVLPTLSATAGEDRTTTALRIGWAASVDHEWRRHWRSGVTLQRSLLAGAGYSAPIYASSLSANGTGRFGRVSLTGSAATVASDEASRAHALTAGLVARLTSTAEATFEFQDTVMQRVPIAAAAMTDDLRGRRLRASLTIALSR